MNSPYTANKYPLDRAREAAEELLLVIRPACNQVEIAGSVRRQRPQVHDIDIVAWPKYISVNIVDIFGSIIEYSHSMEELLEALYGAGCDDLQVKKRIITCTYKGLPVEIYLAEPDGANYGALLQMRTGSAEFNISLAERAQRMGLKYVAGHGIFRGSERIDAGSEEAIFSTLGIDYIDPEYRQCHWHTAVRMANI
jgi:DNA polymerase (family X)